LRTRTPSKNVIQYIIQGIWAEYSINTVNSNVLMSKTLSNFNSWRNIFNTKLIALANDLIGLLE